MRVQRRPLRHHDIIESLLRSSAVSHEPDRARFHAADRRCQLCGRRPILRRERERGRKREPTSRANVCCVRPSDSSRRSTQHTLTLSKAVDAAVLTLEAEIGRDDVARTFSALCIEEAPSQSSFAPDGMVRRCTPFVFDLAPQTGGHFMYSRYVGGRKQMPHWPPISHFSSSPKRYVCMRHIRSHCCCCTHTAAVGKKFVTSNVCVAFVCFAPLAGMSQRSSRVAGERAKKNNGRFQTEDSRSKRSGFSTKPAGMGCCTLCSTCWVDRLV